VNAHGYVHGCNYPWSTDGRTVFYGLDFGGNVWGSHLGVSTRRDAIARDFDEMAALGFLVARWFVFCDGRAGIAYDERGLPAGLDSWFFADLDAALEIAIGAGMALDLVLLDHTWMFGGVHERVWDPATGAALEARLPQGRAEVLHSRRGRQALFDCVFEPLVRRYGPSGDRADLAAGVFAYELMNEPDFVIDEWEADVSPQVSRPLPFEAMADLIGRLSDLVHTGSTAIVTLGGARARNLWAWEQQELGLDVLQVHAYPDTRHPDRDVEVFGLSPSALGVSRPLVLGEFPGHLPGQVPASASPPATTTGEYLEFAFERGYVGAWPWSFSGTDGYGRLSATQVRAFGQKHPSLVNSRFRP
jgi:hypothetical protein